MDNTINSNSGCERVSIEKYYLVEIVLINRVV